MIGGMFLKKIDIGREGEVKRWEKNKICVIAVEINIFVCKNDYMVECMQNDICHVSGEDDGDDDMETVIKIIYLREDKLCNLYCPFWW